VESFARAAPDARIEVIEGDHFDVYSPPLRERAAELAAEFLAAKLD
jgi:thioesterase domain-containing protein